MHNDKVGKRILFQSIFIEVWQKLIRSPTPSRYLYAKYNDPSSSGSPDTLFTSFHRFTMHKSKKGYNSATTTPTEDA